jgi:hypothetical protein
LEFMPASMIPQVVVATIDKPCPSLSLPVLYSIRRNHAREGDSSPSPLSSAAQKSLAF